MEALSKPRKSSKHRSKSKTKSRSKSKSKTTVSKSPSKASKVKKISRPRKTSFDEITDCHKALLKIALRKGLYPEIKTDFESARYSTVLDFVHKHISRKADKAIMRIYQAIEKISKRNRGFTRSASRGAMDGGDEVAQSSA